MTSEVSSLAQRFCPRLVVFECLQETLMEQLVCGSTTTHAQAPWKPLKGSLFSAAYLQYYLIHYSICIVDNMSNPKESTGTLSGVISALCGSRFQLNGIHVWVPLRDAWCLMLDQGEETLSLSSGNVGPWLAQFLFELPHFISNILSCLKIQRNVSEHVRWRQIRLVFLAVFSLFLSPTGLKQSVEGGSFVRPTETTKTDKRR